MTGVMVARLAVESHAEAAGDLLDLRTSPDEIDFVSPAPPAIWAEFTAKVGGSEETLELASDYGFSDPYGGTRASSVLSAYHGAALEAGSLAFGAGISGLLRQLAPIAANGRLLIEDLGHPDAAHWAESSGASIDVFEHEELLSGELALRIREVGPAIVSIDRPNVLGDLVDIGVLRGLSRAAADVGAAVVVDEAHANYLEPSVSMVPFVRDLGHVVVLRSLSKAYRLGGLRIAYAVSGADISLKIRSAIAPLGVSSLAFHFALQLLSEGDIFGGLRARIATSKREATALFEARGFRVFAGHSNLPWLLLHDERGAVHADLRELGLLSRPVSALSARAPKYVKVSIPLSDSRRAALEERLGR